LAAIFYLSQPGSKHFLAGFGAGLATPPVCQANLDFSVAIIATKNPSPVLIPRLSRNLGFSTLRGMAKETPISRLLAHRGGLVRRTLREGGFGGGNLKRLRDLTEDKPESRTLTPMPLSKDERLS
jgi:hypothetical protein